MHPVVVVCLSVTRFPFWEARKPGSQEADVSNGMHAVLEDRLVHGVLSTKYCSLRQTQPAPFSTSLQPTSQTSRLCSILQLCSCACLHHNLWSISHSLAPRGQEGTTGNTNWGAKRLHGVITTLRLNLTGESASYVGC
jgi:hypothetical protein